MKNIVLENKSIVKIYNFLKGVPLKGKASRGRTKFQKRLQEKEEEYITEKQEIQKKYVQLDENGQFIVLEDGVSSPLREDLTTEEKKLFLEQLKELENDTFVISFAEYSDKFENMFKELDLLEMKLTDEDAEAYNELMDAYEANEMEGE